MSRKSNRLKSRLATMELLIDGAIKANGHLLGILECKRAEAAKLRGEVMRLNNFNRSLAERVAAQSELLSKRAEKESSR